MNISWKTAVTTPPQSKHNKHLVEELLGLSNSVGCSFTQYSPTFAFFCFVKKQRMLLLSILKIQNLPVLVSWTNHDQGHYRKWRYATYKIPLVSQGAMRSLGMPPTCAVGSNFNHCLYFLFLCSIQTATCAACDRAKILNFLMIFISSESWRPVTFLLCVSLASIHFWVNSYLNKRVNSWILLEWQDKSWHISPRKHKI